MFENIGEKIKGYAKILFVIEVIAGIIGAIVIAVGIGKESGGFIGFLMFLVSGAISIVVAYLSVMFIYALGDITENMDQLKRDTKRNYDINYEIYSMLNDKYCEGKHKISKYL